VLARSVECPSRMAKDSTSSPHPAPPPHNGSSQAQSSKTPELIDIGINLAHDSFNLDRESVIAHAMEAGVVQMVVTGSNGASTRESIELARAHPGRLFGTAGVHPHYSNELDAELLDELRQLATLPEVVAVGECGLDYFRDLSPRATQREAFQRQLELASLIRKPVFLHQRDAHADFLAILREHRDALVGGVAHCFTGNREELIAYLDLDLAIGITGWICDERRGAHLLSLVREIPADRLLLETDGPYLLPRDLPVKPVSRRNEPRFLPHIAATVARARAEPVETLARSSTMAARRLFGLPGLEQASID
jgi:TatD DNase family protein